MHKTDVPPNETVAVEATSDISMTMNLVNENYDDQELVIWQAPIEIPNDQGMPGSSGMPSICFVYT